MEFSRVGEHTIKCIISEEEIFDLGFTLNEIMSNGERTQEFMNRIFDMTEQEFQMKFDLGVKTVRADFLPNHTLSLTFSEHPGATGMMEHLKDIVNGLINSIPKEKWEEIQKAKEEVKEQDGKEAPKEDPVQVIVLFTFPTLEVAATFAKYVDLPTIPKNALYKYKKTFWLVMDLSSCTEEEVKRLSMLTDEYACDIQVGVQRQAFLKEHGDCILAEAAIEQLRQI